MKSKCRWDSNFHLFIKTSNISSVQNSFQFISSCAHLKITDLQQFWERFQLYYTIFPWFWNDSFNAIVYYRIYNFQLVQLFGNTRSSSMKSLVWFCQGMNLKLLHKALLRLFPLISRVYWWCNSVYIKLMIDNSTFLCKSPAALWTLERLLSCVNSNVPRKFCRSTKHFLTYATSMPGRIVGKPWRRWNTKIIIK